MGQQPPQPQGGLAGQPVPRRPAQPVQQNVTVPTHVTVLTPVEDVALTLEEVIAPTIHVPPAVEDVLTPVENVEDVIPPRMGDINRNSQSMKLKMSEILFVLLPVLPTLIVVSMKGISSMGYVKITKGKDMMEALNHKNDDSGFQQPFDSTLQCTAVNQQCWY